MRFGISEMSGMRFIRSVRSVASAEELTAQVAAFDRVDSVRELAGRGFDPIELAGDLPLLFPDAFAPATVERLAALREELGLTYTVHLPLWSVEPSTPIAPVRRGSVQALVDAIRVTAPLRPETYVLHATNALASEFARRPTPPIARAFLLGKFQDSARASLTELLAETGVPGRKLAIETVEFPFELTLGLAEELDLSICFDTGHVLVGYSGPIDVFDALDRCLHRVAEIHFHDGESQGAERTVRFGKDHQRLGVGDLDLARFLDRLETAGFAGPLVFELGVDDALASLDVVRASRPRLVRPSLPSGGAGRPTS